MSHPYSTRFHADTLKVLRALPPNVRKDIGFALDEAERGLMPAGAKHRNDIGKGTIQISTNVDKETYRTFYIERVGNVNHVFHIVHKKATKGKGLPKHQIAVTKKRHKTISKQLTDERTE